MAGSSIEKINKRRLQTTYLSVVISIGLVLFLLGILGLFLINAQKIADQFKEQIALTIYIKDDAKAIDIEQLQKTLRFKAATKSINFVSKEEAAERYIQDIGEDFMEFLGYNPLQNSIDVFFNSAYVTPQLLEETSSYIQQYPFISEVVYDQPLLELLDKNINRLSTIVLGACALFLLIAILLINSSIRLSIYSKRLIIKTMQLVGATQSFIRKPFIWKHIRLGLWGILIAWAALAGTIYQLDEIFPELNLLMDYIPLGIIAGVLLLIGLSVTTLSTFMATQRYLNLKTQAVY
ncbi:MAG: cell division protein FtsX [Flavobacteriaceae bacterium]